MCCWQSITVLLTLQMSGGYKYAEAWWMLNQLLLPHQAMKGCQLNCFEYNILNNEGNLLHVWHQHVNEKLHVLIHTLHIFIHVCTNIYICTYYKHHYTKFKDRLIVVWSASRRQINRLSNSIRNQWTFQNKKLSVLKVLTVCT